MKRTIRRNNKKGRSKKPRNKNTRNKNTRKKNTRKKNTRNKNSRKKNNRKVKSKAIKRYSKKMRGGEEYPINPQINITLGSFSKRSGKIGPFTYSPNFWILINNYNIEKKSNQLLITIKFKLNWIGNMGEKSIDLDLHFDVSENEKEYITDANIDKGIINDAKNLIKKKKIDTRIYDKIKDEFKITNNNIKNIINNGILHNRRILPININLLINNKNYSLTVNAINTRDKIQLTYDDGSMFFIPIEIGFKFNLKNIDNIMTIHYNETNEEFVFIIPNYTVSNQFTLYNSIHEIIQNKPEYNNPIYSHIFTDTFINYIESIAKDNILSIFKNIDSNIRAEFKNINNLHQVINAPDPIPLSSLL